MDQGFKGADPLLDSEGIVFEEVHTVEARAAGLPRKDPKRKDSILIVGLPGLEEPEIFLSSKVSKEMVTHAQSRPEVEIGGLMLGVYGQDEGRHFVEVKARIPAEHTHGTARSLHFTAKTWSALGRVQEQQFPHLTTLGWYHSHPVSGVFFSDKDRFIQRSFFPLSWQIAVVVDPRQPRLGVFRWRADQIVVCGYRVIT